MNPQLQTAFDSMYAKAEMFLPANIAKQCLIHIRKGNVAIPVGEVAAALAEYTPIPSTAPHHRKAVTAFGDFWTAFAAALNPQPSTLN